MLLVHLLGYSRGQERPCEPSPPRTPNFPCVVVHLVTLLVYHGHGQRFSVSNGKKKMVVFFPRCRLQDLWGRRRSYGGGIFLGIFQTGTVPSRLLFLFYFTARCSFRLRGKSVSRASCSCSSKARAQIIYHTPSIGRSISFIVFFFSCFAV